jgi:hypothetical protein
MLNKIKKWLFKDIIDKYEVKINYLKNTLNEHIKFTDNLSESINSQDKLLSAQHQQIRVLCNDFKEAKRSYISARNLLNSHLEIGVDIHPRSKTSWAVICLDGKPEYVKFIALNNRDIRDIAMFLKQYQGSHNIVDSPFGYSGLINEFIFKN